MSQQTAMFINAEVRSYGPQGARHEHPYAQIIVPLDGDMEIEVEGRGDRLAPGVAAALDIGMAHDFRARPDTHFLIIDVGEQALVEHVELARGLPFRQKVRAIDPRALRFLRYYARELQGSPLPDLPRRLLALTGLALLAESQPAGAPRRHAARMAAAAKWIEERPGSGSDPISHVAARFGLSRSRFGELFRGEHGRSPKQHEIDVRLERAADLLRGSEKTISEIAFEVGYANVSSFTRTFARRYSITPSRFRIGRK